MTEQYLSEWASWCNDIEQTPIPENFTKLLEEASEKYADKCAVNVFEDHQTLSFSQLADQVFSFASSLHDLGVRRGTHIGVMLPNRIEYPIVWLAIASLGAVMIPTNTHSTSHELDYIYNDGDATFVVADSSLMPVIAGMEKRPAMLADKHIIVVGAADECGPNSYFARMVADGDAKFRSDEEITSGTLLNIQYTSGTTGLPKGCMQSQRFWLVAGSMVAAMEPDINSILADHPFFYIDPQWMVVFALKRGACYYLAKGMSSSRFLDWVTEHPIEFCYFPKPLLNREPDPRELKHSIKKFTIGAVSPAILKAGEARFGVDIRQNYGMTEIGPGLMVPEKAPDEAILDTCGLPAPFRELRIVDPDGKDVADGEPGELIVRGDGIFDGYYNKKEANITSFYDDWFRTGDIFVRTPEGYYKIIGRIKDMIRRSNENISALEVEHALMEMEEVAQAAVVPVADEYRGEEVKAYIRLNDGYSAIVPNPASIIEHCKKKLAAFKVPRFLCFVESFPLTPSEKIAKNKLILGVDDLRAGSWDSSTERWL